MFDFDLQLRFWRSVTDVMVHGAQAALAATTALQEQMLASEQPVASPVFAMPALPLPISAMPIFAMFDPALWMGGAASPSNTNPFASSSFASNPFAANPFMNVSPWIEIFCRQSAEMMPVTATAWGSFPQPNPAAMMAPIWGWAASPWAVMQNPLTAMMMQAGFPYAVALPSAKASTAAMDAADAARQQIDNVFSAYRSDGGHAAAQFAAMPWSFAASLMTLEPRPGEKSPAKPAATNAA